MSSPDEKTKQMVFLCIKWLLKVKYSQVKDVILAIGRLHDMQISDLWWQIKNLNDRNFKIHFARVTGADLW